MEAEGSAGSSMESFHNGNGILSEEQVKSLDDAVLNLTQNLMAHMHTFQFTVDRVGFEMTENIQQLCNDINQQLEQVPTNKESETMKRSIGKTLSAIDTAIQIDRTKVSKINSNLDDRKRRNEGVDKQMNLIYQNHVKQIRQMIGQTEILTQNMNHMSAECPGAASVRLAIDIDTLPDPMTFPNETLKDRTKEIMQILNETPMDLDNMKKATKLINNCLPTEKIYLFGAGVVHRLINLIGELGDFDPPIGYVPNVVESHDFRPYQYQKMPPSELFGMFSSMSDYSKGGGKKNRGVGYGSGSQASTWSIDRTIKEQKKKQEKLTAVVVALNAFIYRTGPDFNIYRDNSNFDAYMQPRIVKDIGESHLISLLEYHLKNDSVLDVSENVDLFEALVEIAASMATVPELVEYLVKPYKKGAKSIAFDLIPKFRNCLKTYTQMCDGNDDSPMLKFLKRIDACTQVIMLAADIYEQYRERTKEDEVDESIVPDVKEERMDESEALVDNEVYSNALKDEQMKQYRFVGDNGKFEVPYAFHKEILGTNPTTMRERTKRIAKELASMLSSLPLNISSSIFVRVDESRCDIIKVMISGPEDTPYANGLFEFDFYFPPDYPRVAPKCSFLTTGNGQMRFNPNLYNNGKVCLSILGTWPGRPEEQWNAKSSLLQVLVSIQALIFVKEPYFNEPGYEKMEGTEHGNYSSRSYNRNIEQATFHFAIKDQMKSPSRHFKEVVEQHFWLKRHSIIRQGERFIEEILTPIPKVKRVSYAGAVMVGSSELGTAYFNPYLAMGADLDGEDDDDYDMDDEPTTLADKPLVKVKAKNAPFIVTGTVSGTVIAYSESGEAIPLGSPLILSQSQHLPGSSSILKKAGNSIIAVGIGCTGTIPFGSQVVIQGTPKPGATGTLGSTYTKPPQPAGPKLIGLEPGTILALGKPGAGDLPPPMVFNDAMITTEMGPPPGALNQLLGSGPPPDKSHPAYNLFSQALNDSVSDPQQPGTSKMPPYVPVLEPPPPGPVKYSHDPTGFATFMGITPAVIAKQMISMNKKMAAAAKGVAEQDEKLAKLEEAKKKMEKEHLQEIIALKKIEQELKHEQEAFQEMMKKQDELNHLKNEVEKKEKEFIMMKASAAGTSADPTWKQMFAIYSKTEAKALMMDNSNFKGPLLDPVEQQKLIDAVNANDALIKSMKANPGAPKEVHMKVAGPKYTGPSVSSTSVGAQMAAQMLPPGSNANSLATKTMVERVQAIIDALKKLTGPEDVCKIFNQKPAPEA